MFVAREQELKTLNKFYERDRSSFIAIYGRRRVGKTALIRHFINDKNGIFFSAEESNEKNNLLRFTETYKQFTNQEIGLFDTWERLFSKLIEDSKKERLIVVIDEFPYLSSNNQSFLSKFQHIYDHMLKDANIMLIICGSSITFMEDEVFSQKSPLFGRLTGQMMIKPFDYYDAGKMLPDFCYQEQLEAYFILGGMPQYLKSFSSSDTLSENIIQKILDGSEVLFNAPSNTLKQELRSPAVYNAVIEAISNGATKYNDITTKAGINSSVGQNYLARLMKLHLVKKIKPIGSDSNRKTIYLLDDSLFDFVYRFAYPYRSPIELELGSEVYEKFIQPNLPTYYGRKFEHVCHQYLMRLNKQLLLPTIITEIGTWWGGNPSTKAEEEIDIVGMSDEIGIYGECKYRNEVVGKKVLDDLIRKSLLIPKPIMHYYLFSKSGFSHELIDYAKERSTIHLITIDDLFNI